MEITIRIVIIAVAAIAGYIVASVFRARSEARLAKEREKHKREVEMLIEQLRVCEKVRDKAIGWNVESRHQLDLVTSATKKLADQRIRDCKQIRHLEAENARLRKQLCQETVR